MLEASLKSKINSLWNKFWSSGLTNPLTAIENLSYLIFIMRLEKEDDRITKRNPSHKSIFEGDTEINGVKFNRKECRWSEWSLMDSEEMLAHFHSKVFPFIKTLGKKDIEELGEKEDLYIKVMKNATFVIQRPALLKEAVKTLTELKITEQNYDVQGDIYEFLLSELATSGKNGQFRTPRHIIKMITKLVNPDINDKIGDMACGTGGFLVSAYQHILEKYTPKEHIEYDEQGNVHSLTGANLTDDKHWKKLRTNTFFGYDNDQTMVKIALMNLMLHGITEPHIKEEDTLSENYEESAEKFTVLLENPPFKGTIDSSLIHKDLKLLNTKKTELLFVKKSLDLLEVGGRLGIILPDGVLFGSSKAHKALREEIIEENTLDAVISLPSGVFKPYAGVSTAILIIKKGGETSKTWFYNMTSDGYSLDDKRNFIDGKGDITDIVENFLEKDEGRTGKCFFVESQEIKDKDYDLSISKYQEIEYEQKEHRPSKDILKDIKDNLSEELNEIEELERLI